MKIVTATTDLDRAADCLRSWRAADADLVFAVNGTPGIPDVARYQITWSGDYLGTVQAFARGMDLALASGDPIIACLHDDLRIDDPTWQAQVEAYFADHPRCGLLGFGGALGLGRPDIYRHPYDPYDLVRRDFRSNLDDAEVHGIRSLVPHRVACLDGFSQIFRREFAETRPYQYLYDHGIFHHFYDGALGCLAHRYAWEVHYLPIPCHHYGGRTAVGDQGYQEWALAQIPEGDQGFWLQAHKVGYQLFVDVLPIQIYAEDVPLEDDGLLVPEE